VRARTLFGWIPAGSLVASLLTSLLAGPLAGPLAGQDPEASQRACDAGVMQSCDALGLRYEAGLEVTQDLERAVGLFQTACDGELMLGCSHLGSMYRAGMGVGQDLSTAVSLYRRACDGRMMEACANLAISYERGDGVAQDGATAVGLYQRACEGGVAWTCARVETANDPDAGAPRAYGFRIVASVVDTETRNPLSEAIVDMPALGIRVITDESGRVDFGELPVGRHRLKAERVGYQVIEAELLVPGDREVVIPLERTTTSDSEAPGRVVGQILEGGRESGVSDVLVTVLASTPVSTLSDPQGRFSLTGVETGLVEVQFERLGYVSRTATVIVQPDRTVEIAASMSARPIDLDPITVVVRSRALELNGFYLRDRVGGGTRLTREDLMVIDPLYISDIFRRIPGVRVENGQILGRRTGFDGNSPCNLRVFLDGIAMEGWDFDSIPAEYLEGMEVYQGLAVPIQYGPGCGVVLLWTRGG